MVISERSDISNIKKHDGTTQAHKQCGRNR